MHGPLETQGPISRGHQWPPAWLPGNAELRADFAEPEPALQSPVALEQPRKRSRLSFGVVFLGILRTDGTAWVISGSGDCGKVSSCEVFCCRVVILKGADCRQERTPAQLFAPCCWGVQFYMASTGAPRLWDAFIRKCVSPSFCYSLSPSSFWKLSSEI